MWPSFETASRLYDVANVALIASLVIGVVATGTIVWMGNVKEAQLRRDVAAAGERAANANVAAGNANERAATLEAEAAQLRIDLERERAERIPRTISQTQRGTLVELLSPERIPKPHVLVNAAMDGEAAQFGDALADVLRASGFNVEPVPFGERAVTFNRPGLFLWIKNAKNPPKGAGSIVEAFRRVGIMFVAEEHPASSDVHDENTVVMAVSSHP